ncbi:uncharacterized protein BDV14DRAFT_199063 [Aspergillus stella-maris]|uniref:uncharacterized protein n=1 Tax=Aspergillus stella-maris TaxID=1810926 RepID=UPI003CCDF29B
MSKQTPQVQVQGHQSFTVSDYIRYLRRKRNEDKRSQLLTPTELRHESPLSQLEMDYHQLSEDLSNSSISSTQATERVKEMSHLARSNAVRGRNPPNKSSRRDSLLGSSSSSSSGSPSGSDDEETRSRPRTVSGSGSHYFSTGYTSPTSTSPSGVRIAKRLPIQKYPVRDLNWRPSDEQLPSALRQLVDEGRSCDVIGLYIVCWLHYKESRYSGLVSTQVAANKPYWEITVRLFKTLDLRNDCGQPLHANIVLGHPNSVPCPEKPTQRGLSDPPELHAPSHARLSIIGTQVRSLLDGMTDEQLERYFVEEDEKMSDAHVVSYGTPCTAARIVQTNVPVRVISRKVNLNNINDSSNWI